MSKILLYSHDNVGKTMAGPGIRYFEMAKALSKDHQVVLLVPNDPDITYSEIKIEKISTFSKHIQNSDVLISQLLHPKMVFFAKRYGVKIILDAYDPMPLENLEVFKSHSKAIRHHKNNRIQSHFQFSFQMADAILSGSPKQRDLWTGYLMNLGKINPKTYDEDNSLKHLIDIVPFGLPETPPKMQNGSIRSRFGIPKNAHIILWGGGIWNWFDPLTLIRAISEMEREDVFLVFMGVKHPNPQVPEMQMANEAVELAKKLNLFDRKVFFNFGWTTYEERQNFLLEATIGISLHHEHLETQYSFRTRILDYLWAKLPIISTKGDYFADLISKENLGIVIPQKDSDAVKKAILELIDNPEKQMQIKENISKIIPQFHWNKVVQPIHNMIDTFSKQSKSTLSFKDVARIIFFQCKKYSPMAIYGYACTKK